LIQRAEMAFKEHDPSIRCYVVEPEGVAVLAGKPVSDPHHRIQGSGYAMPHLAMLNAEHIDGYLQVRDQETIDIARRFA
jgi:cysteine synthase A